MAEKIYYNEVTGSAAPGSNKQDKVSTKEITYNPTITPVKDITEVDGEKLEQKSVGLDKLKKNEIFGAIFNQFTYGDGSDGDLVIPNASTTTLTSDVFYNDLTIQQGGTLNTAGFRVFVKNRLTNYGRILPFGNFGQAAWGSNGTDGASGGAYGAGAVGTSANPAGRSC